METDFLRQLREALEQRASELEAQSERLAEVTGYPAAELVVRPKAMAEAYGTVADAIALEDVGVILKRTGR